MKLLTLFVFLFSIQSQANETPAYACAFEKPFIFGASISAGYSSMKDALTGRRLREGETFIGSNDSPTTRMAKSFFDKPQITNIAEIVNTMMFFGYGHRQFYAAYNDDGMRGLIEEASIWASLDAFYWPSANGSCDEAIQGVDTITAMAQAMNKPLILATVPEENPDNVDWLIRKALFPMQTVCIDSINSALVEKCKIEDRCYLIDLYKTVNDLNGDGVDFNGKLNFAYDFRFDGVHLNDEGISYVMKLIDDKLSKKAPNCSNVAD